MPRRIVPKPCACGCGQMTKGGEYCPGHDSAVYRAIILEVGGITKLREIVEGHVGHQLEIDLPLK